MKVDFTKKQRKTIRRVISLQLAALQAIITENCEDDITLYCIELGITKDKLFSKVADNIDDYAHVYEHPEELMNLPDLSIIKDIMMTHGEWGKVKSQIWRKMMVYEQLNFNPN